MHRETKQMVDFWSPKTLALVSINTIYSREKSLELNWPNCP